MGETESSISHAQTGVHSSARPVRWSAQLLLASGCCDIRQRCFGEMLGREGRLWVEGEYSEQFNRSIFLAAFVEQQGLVNEQNALCLRVWIRGETLFNPLFLRNDTTVWASVNDRPSRNCLRRWRAIAAPAGWDDRDDYDQSARTHVRLRSGGQPNILSTGALDHA